MRSSSSAVVRLSRRRKWAHAKLSTLGVEIIDGNGDHLVGITEEDALHLLGSLAKIMPRVLRRLPTSDDILF